MSSHDDASLIPPQEMLCDGSPSPEEFVRLGDRFCTQLLIPRARLVPDAAILDLGCGNGAVARALTKFLAASGRYEGVDIDARSVAWLQEHYKPYPTFRFQHADVGNDAYNLAAGRSAAEYRLPFAGDPLCRS